MACSLFFVEIRCTLLANFEGSLIQIILFRAILERLKNMHATLYQICITNYALFYVGLSHKSNKNRLNMWLQHDKT